MTYEGMFLRALAATLAVETAVLWGIMRFAPGGGVPSVRRLTAAGILCSSATLPYLWFVLPAWVKDHGALLALGEPAVAAAEAAILAGMLGLKPGRALAVSTACNLASFLFGLAVFG